MLYNLTKAKIIARNPYFFTYSPYLYRKILKNNFMYCDAIVLQNRKFIFTLFLYSKPDIVFIDKTNSVSRIFSSTTKPWKKLWLSSKDALYILLLPNESTLRLNIEINDKLDMSAVITAETKKKLEEERLIFPEPTAFTDLNKRN